MISKEGVQKKIVELTENTHDWDNNPAGIYMFKVNNRNVRTKCEICLKLTKKDTRTRLPESIRLGAFLWNNC